MNEQSAVFWKGEFVGSLTGLSNDMWYYEGEWAGADSAIGREFVTVVRALDPQTVREFPDKGF